MSLNAKEEMWVRKQVMVEEQRTAEQSELIEPLGVTVVSVKLSEPVYTFELDATVQRIDVLVAPSKKVCGGSVSSDMVQQHCLSFTVGRDVAEFAVGLRKFAAYLESSSILLHANEHEITGLAIKTKP